MPNSIATPAPDKGNWDKQKNKLKARFTDLMKADLDFEGEKKDEMLKKIHDELGTSKEDVLKIIT